MIYTLNYDSPVGRLLLAEKDGSLIGLWMEGQKYYSASFREEMSEKPDSPVLCQTKQWLDRYFSGNKPQINELPLSPVGSEFRKAVWKILCEIPYGQTTTYGEIAQKMAEDRGLETMSAQAVGGAVGHNPVSIIIPCHRVVGTNGSLTGYAGGMEKKIWLLTYEGADMNGLFIPKKESKIRKKTDVSFFKSLVDQDRCPVVICDLKSEILYMNPSAVENYAKWGGSRLIGKSLLDCHNPQSQEKIQKVLDWFAEEESHNIVYTFHNEKQNKDVYMVALRDGGKLIGYYEKHEYRNPETMKLYDLI